MTSFSSLIKDYRVVDLSHTFEESMPRPQVPYGHIPWKSYEKGDAFNTYMFLVFEHAGTHVDAPIHLGGVEGHAIDEIPLESWMGDLCVLDMTHKQEREFVTIDEVKAWEKTHGEINEDEMVLFNFGWESRWTTDYGVENQIYLKDNPGLSEEAARYLVSKKIKLVGGDTPTIDSDADPEEHAHRVLLPSGVLIIENVSNLDKLPPRGAYLMALPLKIKDGTGCPVRAVAFIPKDNP
ncbi:MAG: cyclase family protein [Candidatus Bathyarchaeota archaeon]|nr:cyclase family protein [Candidatus Bathyarchaeota archaeon]